MFPPQSIDPSMSHEVILYRAGQRSVVEWIKAQLEELNYVHVSPLIPEPEPMPAPKPPPAAARTASGTPAPELVGADDKVTCQGPVPRAQMQQAATGTSALKIPLNTGAVAQGTKKTLPS